MLSRVQEGFVHGIDRVTPETLGMYRPGWGGGKEGGDARWRNQGNGGWGGEGKRGKEVGGSGGGGGLM